MAGCSAAPKARGRWLSMLRIRLFAQGWAGSVRSRLISWPHRAPRPRRAPPPRAPPSRSCAAGCCAAIGGSPAPATRQPPARSRRVGGSTCRLRAGRCGAVRHGQCLFRRGRGTHLCDGDDRLDLGRRLRRHHRHGRSRLERRRRGRQRCFLGNCIGLDGQGLQRRRRSSLDDRLGRGRGRGRPRVSRSPSSPHR